MGEASEREEAMRFKHKKTRSLFHALTAAVRNKKQLRQAEKNCLLEALYLHQCALEDAIERYIEDAQEAEMYYYDLTDPTGDWNKS